MQLFRGLATALATTAVLVASQPLAHAETLESALVKAYHNNPQLNAQRASVRATDEGVSKAEAGYRPKITASGEMREPSASRTAAPSKPSTAGTISTCRRRIASTLGRAPPPSRSRTRIHQRRRVLIPW